MRKNDAAAAAHRPEALAAARRSTLQRPAHAAGQAQLDRPQPDGSAAHAARAAAAAPAGARRRAPSRRPRARSPGAVGVARAAAPAAPASAPWPGAQPARGSPADGASSRRRVALERIEPALVGLAASPAVAAAGERSRRGRRRPSRRRPACARRRRRAVAARVTSTTVTVDGLAGATPWPAPVERRASGSAPVGVARTGRVAARRSGRRRRRRSRHCAVLVLGQEAPVLGVEVDVLARDLVEVGAERSDHSPRS